MRGEEEGEQKESGHSPALSVSFHLHGLGKHHRIGAAHAMEDSEKMVSGRKITDDRFIPVVAGHIKSGGVLRLDIQVHSFWALRKSTRNLITAHSRPQRTPCTDSTPTTGNESRIGITETEYPDREVQGYVFKVNGSYKVFVASDKDAAKNENPRKSPISAHTHGTSHLEDS